MTIQEILDAVAEQEREITDLPPGSPQLRDALARVSDLEAEVERQRSLQGPLVPDASSPPTLEEKSLAELAEALHSLRRAIGSKTTEGSAAESPTYH
jgi:hypothetical protein